LLKFMTDGDNMAEQKNWRQAIPLYKDAQNVDPSHTAINNQLGHKICNAYVTLSIGPAALEACTEAVTRDPVHAGSHMKRAEAYIMMEKYQEAVYDYNKALQLEQGNNEAQQGLQRAQALLKRSLKKDYYKILGVPKTASSKDIKKAFRNGALRYHPDKMAGQPDEVKHEMEVKFRELGQAYEVLMDADLRKRYDSGEDITGSVAEKNGQTANQQQGGNPFGFPFGQQTYTFRWGG